MSKVESGIRELNIGEIRKIDADGKPVPQNGLQNY
jgi:hypothetical protein